MRNFDFIKKLNLIPDEIKCEYLNNGCKLGWYGGNPTIQNCKTCIAAERNSKESKIKSDFISIISHPPTARKVSGCCDSARNYIDR
jgi:hypothetical protein